MLVKGGPGELSQHWGYWWLNTLHYQVISSHDTDSMQPRYSCLPCEWNSTVCNDSVQRGDRKTQIYISVSKFKNIYRYDVPVTFELYSHFMCFRSFTGPHRSFILNETRFTKYCVTQWISNLPGVFMVEIHLIRQYLVNFMGLSGIVNENV